MSSPVVTQSGAYLPTVLNTLDTLGPDTTAGIKTFDIDLTNLPAGTILDVSIQKIQLSAGAYIEEFHDDFQNSVAISANPGNGYEPIQESEPIMSPFGFQVVVQILSGTLPATGLNWSIKSV